jgi:DNA-binding SARP family transcriptional activator
MTAGAEIRLSLLNGFELSCGQENVCLPLTGQRLLAFLAVQDHPLVRLFVAATLWPDTSEDRACANLRSTLWRINRSGLPLIAATGQRLALASPVLVDVRETVALARRVLAGVLDIEREDYVPLFSPGQLLCDCYDEWALQERERYHQLRLHALEQLCDDLIKLGRVGQAIEAGLAVVATEPLRESAQRLLVRGHLAEGNHVEALRRYEAYRTLLRKELGIAPTSQMDDLVRPLLAIREAALH